MFGPKFRAILVDRVEEVEPVNEITLLFKNLTPICGLRQRPLKLEMDSTRFRRIAEYDKLRTQAKYWPWMAGLFFSSQFECGATIVSQRFVVSAAHCRGSAAFLPSEYLVTAGHTSRLLSEAKYEKGFQSFKVLQFHTHPKYKRRENEFDIILIQLKSKPATYNSPALKFGWTFTKKVQPICIDESQPEIGPSSRCFITGWGKTQGERPDVGLQQARVKARVNH